MKFLDQLRKLSVAVAFAEEGEFATAIEIAGPLEGQPVPLSTFLSDLGLDTCRVRFFSVSV